MYYQPTTSTEAARLLRSLLFQYGAEVLADMTADACTAMSIEAQQNGGLDACAEFQRAAHHYAEASASIYGDNPY